MTKRKVHIFITSRRWANLNVPAVPDFTDDDEEYEDEDDGLYDTENTDGEPMELMTEGHLVTGPARVELVYDEGALSGMEGSVTSIGFDRKSPHVITMMRSGLVRTAMVFELKKRHMSVYETPFTTFSVCVTARKVINSLFEDGTIQLHYTTAVNGQQTELCHMTVKVTPAD